MDAHALLAALNRRGVAIEAVGSRLRYYPRSRVTADEQTAVAKLKVQILEILAAEPVRFCPSCGHVQVSTEHAQTEAGPMTRWWCPRFADEGGPGCGRVDWVVAAAEGVAAA